MITMCNFFVHAELHGRPSQEIFGMSKMDALDFTITCKNGCAHAIPYSSMRLLLLTLHFPFAAGNTCKHNV